MSGAATTYRLGADGNPCGAALYPVRKVCGWCKCDMGLASFRYAEPDVVTHGICDPCMIKEIRAIKERRKVLVAS